MFHEDGDGSGDTGCCSDDEEFDPGKVFGDGGRFDDIGCDRDEEGFDPEMLYGDGDGFDDIGCDYYNNDYQEFDSMRFHGFSKNYEKVHNYFSYTTKYRGAAHSICNCRYKMQKEIPLFFHNGSNYDYHFIIKQLTEEFEGQFECLGENTEKYISFSIAIEKHDNRKTIQYKIRFTDSVRFMASSFLILADNLEDGLHKGKCEDYKSNLKSMTDKDCLLSVYTVKKTYEKKFDEYLSKRFKTTYQFCDGGINQILSHAARSCYIFMDTWMAGTDLMKHL